MKAPAPGSMDVCVPLRGSYKTAASISASASSRVIRFASMPRVIFVLLALACVSASASAQHMIASPPSTLLQPGVTSLPLALWTDDDTNCRWSISDVPYASMPNSFSGAGSCNHSAVISGLTGTLALRCIYVQCEAYAARPSLVLSFRSLPDSAALPFPRLGNLWGSGNFRGHAQGLAYAANRSSLWLGADWSAAEIDKLRDYNAFTVVLTSINACETNAQDLPDDFYLTNITQPPATLGRLQSWPGAWRLDLTNPDVQMYQAQLMYCLVVYGGSGYGPKPGCVNASVPPLVFDGLFVDNVFMDDGAGVNSQDIFHNPFVPLDRQTGKAMVDFGGRWKAGMVSMLKQFRSMMPHAILHGHAMDVSDDNISTVFNAMSIGFVVPQIVQQRQSFASAFQTYKDWMSLPTRSPKLTMVESAVRLQLAYGYGFNNDIATLISFDCRNSNSVPGAPVPAIGNACASTQPYMPGSMQPPTFLFARSEYKYMRFGLAFTLMQDGYFTHELGDSWHGQDWDYDELHFSLGLALRDYTFADVIDPNPPPIPPPIPLKQSWFLYVRAPDVSNASWAVDPLVRPSGDAPPSVRVDVDDTAAASDGIDLSQVVQFEAGGYQLSFWAKSARDGTRVQLNSRKNGGDWRNWGLDVSIVLTSQWLPYNVTFTSVSNGSEGRLSWFMGAAAANTSIWVNAPQLNGVAVPPPVLVREFECGVALVNGDTVPRLVQLPSALRRLDGQQAPLLQYIVDDSSIAFETLTGTWEVETYESGYNGARTPLQEEVRPPNGFYHHWEVGAHRAPAGSSASFNLSVPQEGLYNVFMWWPAAVPARASWAQDMRVSIGPLQLSVNLSSQGGDVFFPVATGIHLDASSRLVLQCAAAAAAAADVAGDCIADAVLVESLARFNDGSAVDTLTLQPTDGIILQRTTGCEAVADTQLRSSRAGAGVSW